MALELDVWVCHHDGSCEKRGRVVTETVDEAMSEARRTESLGQGDTLCLYPPGERPPSMLQRSHVLLRAGLATELMQYTRKMLKPKQIDAIEKAVDAGAKQSAVARKYGIGENHLRNLLRARAMLRARTRRDG